MAFTSTASVAVASARRRWFVVVAWLLILVAAMAASTVWLESGTTTEEKVLSNTESEQAKNLLDSGMGYETPLREQVIITSDTLTVDDAGFQEIVQTTTDNLRGLTGVVDPAATFNYFEAQNEPNPQIAAQAEGLVSDDRSSTVIPVTLLGELDDVIESYDLYYETARSQATDDVEILVVGDLSTSEAFTTISEEDLAKAEMIGLPIALIILLLVFRAFVAALIPIGLAIVSILVAIGMAATFGQVWTVSIFIANMISMIGLAVGIDYSLFIIERYREERRRGRSQMEAIAVAGGTANKAVLFSGLTVVFALMGLILVPNSIFRSLGLGAVFVVVVAVAAGLTLIPAILNILGDKIEWPRRKKNDIDTMAQQAVYDAEVMHSGFWGRITRVVMAHPVPAVVLSGGFLVLCAIPYFDMNTGVAGVETLPAGEVQSAYTILSEEFSTGLLAPVDIVIDRERTPEIDAAIVAMTNGLNSDERFTQALPVLWNEQEDLAHIQAILSTGPNLQVSLDTVESLREEILPGYFGAAGVQPLVGGLSAFNLDSFNLVEHWTPYVFLFVLTLSFVLLTLAFRSIVVPIKAIIMNLLSVGAAYGLLVLVFQKGYGADFLGFQQTPTIEFWLPLFLFAILFGLSMDYQVFLLSRIREHYDLTHNNTESVAFGLQATARLITGAAMIMVAVFLGFATGRLVFMQQMGFGLAVAVFLDATIVRSILVPASMRLLGDWNWYLPSWLQWLPDLRVEGAPDEVAEPSPAD